MIEIKKVLVIDDNKNEQVFLSRALNSIYSCEVITADNGQQGLEKILMEQPDLAFLDVAMPLMDGIEMLEILRIQYSQIKIPIIALTAKSDSMTLNKLLTLNVDEYLLKPINIEQITSKMEKVLSKY